LDDLSTFEYIEINYDDVLKYEYDMWRLNEWIHYMLWFGVLKTVIAMEYEYDFRVI
jgi:hypothetical protein